MLMNLNNKTYKDRTEIKDNIDNTLNNFWKNVEHIASNPKTIKASNELFRHFIFLEKSIAYMAMDWGINLTLDIRNGKMKGYKTSVAEGGSFCTIDTLYMRITEYTGLDFNKISNKDFINLSLLDTVLDDSTPELYSKLDAVAGRFKNWVKVYEDNGKVALVNKKDKVFIIEKEEDFKQSYFIVE